MKYFTTPQIASIVLGALLAACSAASPGEDKQARLEELKAQQEKIAGQITKLESEIAKKHPEAVKTRSKEVSVAELSPRKFDHFVRLQGKIDAEDNITVSAQTAGLVTRVYAKEGQQVQRGEVLAQLDNAMIIRNIAELKNQLDLVTTLYERQKKLWDQKIGTEVQFLQAKNNKESLENRLGVLEEQNKMTRIESPITGTVDDVAIKIGQSLAPGLPAIRVVNTSQLKAVSMVSEAYISDIKEGNPVVIKVNDLDKTIQTKVSFKSKTIDQLSRSFEVEAALPSHGEFLPNMTLVMEVIFHTEPQALVVPINLVQDINGEKVVYVAEQNGDRLVARKKVVTVVGVYDAKAEVKGLQSGDRIITVGYQGLNDGESIKI